MLTSGEVDRDFAWFLGRREKVTAVALGTDALLAGSGEVKLAAGLLAVALPGADPAPVQELDVRLAEGALVPMMAALGKGDTVGARTLVTRMLPGHAPDIVDDRLVQFRCGCSHGRARAAILRRGAVEIEALADTGDVVRVCCDFCATDFRFDRGELGRLLEDARKSEEAHPA
jgi:molecular chaperone Hsp33